MIKVTYLLHIIWSVFYTFSIALNLIKFNIEDLIIQGVITLYLPILGKSAYENAINKYIKNFFDIFLTSIFYGTCIGAMAVNGQYLIYFLFMFIFTLTYSSTLIISFNDFYVEYINNSKNYFYTLIMIDSVIIVYLTAVIIAGFTTMKVYIVLLLMGCVQLQLIMSLFTPLRLISRVNEEIQEENDTKILFFPLFGSFLFLLPVIILVGEHLIIKMSLYVVFSLLISKIYIFLQINKSKTIHPNAETPLKDVFMVVSVDSIQVGVPIKN